MAGFVHNGCPDPDRPIEANGRESASNSGETMANFLVVHGPNLDLLGRREPGIYGSATLADIDSRLAEVATGSGHTLVSFQSNGERELIERVHAAMDDGTDFLLLNPAGLTHTSVPFRDAVAAAGIPFIEVHLSNPYAREPFRHRSLFSDLAVGVVVGFGAHSYESALEAGIQWISAK